MYHDCLQSADGGSFRQREASLWGIEIKRPSQPIDERERIVEH